MHKAELRKLICAMLLGDGTIESNNNSKINSNHKDTYWFSFHHSMKQVDYAEWKKDQINNFFKKKGIERKFSWSTSIPHYNKRIDKIYYSCRYRLYWPTYFRIFRKWVYRADRTKRAKFLLNQIDSDKHLAIWFMDDGSEESNNNTHVDGSKYRTNPRLMLHICDYTLNDAQLIVEWFKNNYDVEPRVIKTSIKQGQRPRLRFTSRDSRKLFQHLMVYIKQTDSGKSKFSLCLERY